MADTVRNQAVWPQSTAQAPGLGFPILRMVTLLSLATGMLCGMAQGPYAGKETGEMALFRQLLDQLSRGDIVLADSHPIARIAVRRLNCYLSELYKYVAPNFKLAQVRRDDQQRAIVEQTADQADQGSHEGECGHGRTPPHGSLGRFYKSFHNVRFLLKGLITPSPSIGKQADGADAEQRDCGRFRNTFGSNMEVIKQNVRPRCDRET
jgi:hypothetical protein